MTEEQIVELFKCSKDVRYFIENHIKVVHPIDGYTNIALNETQLEILDSLEDGVIYVAPTKRQSGRSTVLMAFLLHKMLFNPHRTYGVLFPKMILADFHRNIFDVMVDGLEDYFKV